MKSEHGYAADIPREQITGYAEAYAADPKKVDIILEYAQKEQHPFRNIRFVKDTHTFDLNGSEARAWAWAESQTTGDIVFPMNTTSQADFTAAGTTHEITHIQFERVWQAYTAERQELARLIRDQRINPALVIDPITNMVREPFTSQFPFIEKLDRYMQNQKLMGIDDGTTSYSKEVWRGFFNGNRDIRSAYHETLAEISAVDTSASRKAWYRNTRWTDMQPSADWRAFYDAVKSLWKEAPILREGLNAYPNRIYRTIRSTPLDLTTFLSPMKGI
jgi:hypothetical protein